MNKQRLLLSEFVGIVLLSSTILSPALAAECSASSGPNRVALLEIYTSEGCSSCPPADRWLSGIASHGYTSDRLIPLALHANYWDYIGWKDAFAKPEFSARQQSQAELTHASTVYTPQVMLNGQDFRSWSSDSKLSAAVAAINHTPARANIQLSLNPLVADSLEVSASAQAPKQENAVMYVALYESDLVTQVKAGENSGAQLHHDYVVREWLGPYAIDDKSVTPQRQKVTLKSGWKSKNMGVAAFVQNRMSGEVLQALSTGLCS